jgi:Fe-S-cluster containining protein
MPAFCLSVHAAYACRHSGACCSAPWRIPVEAARLPLLRSHREIAEILDQSHDGPYFPRRAEGTCVFFESHRDRLCTVHRVGGLELLPSACRHFPRVVLNDARGSFVTLSSFCPTAAAMLQDDVPLRIIEAPPAFLPGGTLEGLDATAVLPPLLCEGVLTDYEGYSAWEREAIAVLDRDDLHVDEAIRVVAQATERAQRWRPGVGRLADHVAAAFATAAPPHRTRVCAGARPLRMFAAAHLFGSWAAYQNGGIGGVVRDVRDAVARLQGPIAAGATFIEAARATDLVLRHTEGGGDRAGA